MNEKEGAPMREIQESEKVRERNRKVLDAAIELAEVQGYKNIFRRDVAKAAGVGNGSVNNAFGNMDGLKDAIMRAAVERGIAIIVGQGLAEGHPVAKNAPQALREQAGAAIAA